MKRAQRGAALLLAMLTMMLVATFAATALWQQWRGVEVEAAERARSQSSWLLVGALDWARLILREDGRASDNDHLGEPWAVPLQESRLSTFLAAERGAVQAGDDDLPEVFLSGRIIDLQSRMNVAALVNDKGEVAEQPRLRFQRLFDLLGLPPQELATLERNLALARTRQLDEGDDAPLWPQRFEQLAWLGLSPATLQALAPYVTVLTDGKGEPVDDVPINLNTASAEVIAAAIDGLDLADAQRLVASRARNALGSIADAAQRLQRDGELGSHLAVTSRYFEVHGQLRMEGTLVHERSLLHRAGNRNSTRVTTIWRERTAGGTMP